MPQKSLQWRTKIARRDGRAPALKQTDLAASNEVSPHAAKKSRYVVTFVPVEGRSVGIGSPPGKAKKKPAFPEPRAAYRAEKAAVGGGRRPSANSSEPHRRRASTVQGRKKPPSQMGVK